MEKNGHDPLTVEMIAVLKGIRSDIQATNTRLDTLREEMHEELGALRAEVTSVKNEVSGLRVEIRADLEDIRSTQSDHGARIARLEERTVKRVK